MFVAYDAHYPSVVVFSFQETSKGFVVKHKLSADAFFAYTFSRLNVGFDTFQRKNVPFNTIVKSWDNNKTDKIINY